MPYVASELKQEIRRQALADWSDETFALVGPVECQFCCLFGYGGSPPDDM